MRPRATPHHGLSMRLLAIQRSKRKILAETYAVDLDTLPMTNVQSLLPYTWMVWQEALRFHPTVAQFGRVAEVDTTLGGKYKLPAGSLVTIFPIHA